MGCNFSFADGLKRLGSFCVAVLFAVDVALLVCFEPLFGILS